MNRVEKINAKLKRIFFHEDFDDLSKKDEITGPMPDYQSYLDARAEVLKIQSRASTLDCLRPCYDQPLLTRAQEQHLFRQLNYFKYRAKRSVGVGDLGRAETWLARIKEPSDILVGANVRLAIPIVKRYRNKSHFEDLVGESFYLICRAVDYFDFTYGTKFSTYATWVIHKTLGRTAASYYTYDSRHQSADDLFVDSLESRGDGYDQEAEHERAKLLVEELLELAKPRERVVIREMFLAERTLKSVGEDMGLTKERVRQLKMQGIDRIKEAIAGQQFVSEVA